MNTAKRLTPLQLKMEAKRIAKIICKEFGFDYFTDPEDWLFYYAISGYFESEYLSIYLYLLPDCKIQFYVNYRISKKLRERIDKLSKDNNFKFKIKYGRKKA